VALSISVLPPYEIGLFMNIDTRNMPTYFCLKLNFYWNSYMNLDLVKAQHFIWVRTLSIPLEI
jgi:hypothetical protein